MKRLRWTLLLLVLVSVVYWDQQPAASSLLDKNLPVMSATSVNTSPPSALNEILSTPSAITPLTTPYRVYCPFVSSEQVPIHAMRVHYTDLNNHQADADLIENQMKSAGINMVALAAGRAEWTYFKWAGHEQDWSNDVRDSGIDYLNEDSIRFGKWAHINAVVDVFAPNYIKAHPEKAAVSFLGQPSQYLVSTMELVNGEFGQELLAMIEYIAANYPVDSVSLTEMFYHSDGYGPDDKASYLVYTGRTDWPRRSDGQIDIDDVSIGNWRSHVLDVYLDKIVAAVHKHGKKFFLDVGLSLDNYTKITNEHGTNYKLVLEHTDRLVIWGYFDLDNYPPENFVGIAQFLTQFGKDHIILSLGLWDENGSATTADKLRKAILASQEGGMPNLWITPSSLMGPDHWQVLNDLWGR